MNRYNVRITRQVEEQINDIAYHIAVVLNDPMLQKDLLTTGMKLLIPSSTILKDSF